MDYAYLSSVSMFMPVRAGLGAEMMLPLVSMFVLVAGTLLDDAKGLDYARWFVYHSWWFITLASVLAVNVLMAMLVRIPWKRRHIGFLIVHAGLLVLMAGSILTFVKGIDGRLSITEGGPAVEVCVHHAREFGDEDVRVLRQRIAGRIDHRGVARRTRPRASQDGVRPWVDELKAL